jgi:hypothetical protein
LAVLLGYLLSRLALCSHSVAVLARLVELLAEQLVQELLALEQRLALRV